MSWNLTKIPKIAHFYWGNTKMPYLRFLSIESFSRLNPDWEIRLHRPETTFDGFLKTWKTDEHKETIVDTEDYSCEIKNLSNVSEVIWKDEQLGGNNICEIFKSDILRWHLLTHYGGIWSDFDIFYFKPMSEFYANKHAGADKIETVYCYAKSIPALNTHSIGFLMSCKGNRHFGAISKMSKNVFNKDKYQSVGRDLLCKYMIETGNIDDGNSIDLNMNPDVIYYYNYVTIKRVFFKFSTRACFRIIDTFPDEALGIHWYAGDDWSGQKCANWTQQNYKKDVCVLTALINKFERSKEQTNEKISINST